MTAGAGGGCGFDALQVLCAKLSKTSTTCRARDPNEGDSRWILPPSIDLPDASLQASVSRREALRRLGGAASAGVAGASWRSARAQDATPAATPLSIADAQAQLDALDPDTRDSLARALWLPELRADALSPELLASILAAKNSNEAFGLRMGARLLELIATPISFVPGDAEERLATLLPYCASLSPHQAYIMTNLIGNEAAEGYRPVPDKADLQFPQANAMVLDSQVGWYFFVGSCTGAMAPNTVWS